MASARQFIVGNQVSIDGYGAGTITKIIEKSFGTLYNVKINGTEFDFDLEENRLAHLDINQQSKSAEIDLQQQTKGKKRSFDIVNDADVEHFNQQQLNKNTLKKTYYDLKTLKDFFADPAINETREIDVIPPVELCSLLCRFIVGVKKLDGSNYEPSCLKGFISSFDRQLRRRKYVQTLAGGNDFEKLRETLVMKQRQLKCEGKGNMPKRSDAVTDEDVELFWAKGQMGTCSPDTILQTMWFYTTVHFGLRSVQEHRDMCWGDVILKSDRGREYLEYTERQTKTRTGENPRDIRSVKPKLWANEKNPSRCPIETFKVYTKKRPQSYSEKDHPFYIAANTVNLPEPGDLWFRRNPIGINKLGSMMKRLVTRAGLDPNKRLSNHSARKYLIQKLSDNNIPANQIMQISGHKNISSINNYSNINQEQHRGISSILYSENSAVLPSAFPVHADIAVKNPAAASISSNGPNAMEFRSQTNTSSSVYSGTLQHIFGGTVNAGNITINIGKTDNNPEYPARKRLRVVYDTDSD